MHRFLSFLTCITFAFFLLPAGAVEQAAETKQQNLTVSNDGKYLLTPKGKKLYRYYRPVDGFVPLHLKTESGKKIDIFQKTAGTGDIKWHCYDVCVLYDENHVCIQKQRTCDPVLPPIDF